MVGLAVWSLTARAQVVFHTFGQNGSTVGVAGGGSGFGVIHGSAGPGQGQHVAIFAGGNDVSALLMKACDTNQDGAVTPVELKAALVTWFLHADTDTNGALSQLELAAALKGVFPMPVPPPGVPPLPEEVALHNILAKGIMAAVDANQDGWVTFKEEIVYAGQNLARWDGDGNGWLSAQECGSAFGQFIEQGGPERGTTQVFGTSVGGGPEQGIQAGSVRVR